MAEQRTGIEDSKRPQKTIADLFNDLPFRHFPQKQMILYQGDKIERIYYIISGYVRMYNITSKGNERILSILGPGESLPLIQTPHAQYFYEAFTDVEAAYGSYDQIIDRFLADRDYMDAAREASVNLMMRMMEQMDMLSGDNAIDKVEAALRFLAKYYGTEDNGRCTLKFKMTHQELGNLVNLTRETVSNLIQKLERRKVLKTNKDGYISLLNTPEDKEAAKDGRLRDRLHGVTRIGTISDTEVAA